MKNREVIVLIDVVHSVIESCRDQHETFVFTYQGRQIVKMMSSAWKRSREKAADRLEEDTKTNSPYGFRHIRVHDLKHTFGRRLRAAGVSLETRKVLLGHTTGDITSHYSAPELAELLEAANKAWRTESGKSPALSLPKHRAVRGGGA